jgi:hypothetical protein
MSHRKSPAVRHDAPGMAGERSRNESGELRRKRGDTHAGTIEQLYHIDLGVPPTRSSKTSSKTRVSVR